MNQCLNIITNGGSLCCVDVDASAASNRLYKRKMNSLNLSCLANGRLIAVTDIAHFQQISPLQMTKLSLLANIIAVNANRACQLSLALITAFDVGLSKNSDQQSTEVIGPSTE